MLVLVMVVGSVRCEDDGSIVSLRIVGNPQASAKLLYCGRYCSIAVLYDRVACGGFLGKHSLLHLNVDLVFLLYAVPQIDFVVL